jgi:DeoR family transcriptional regulator, fructose operon transcriptional repressor
MEAAIATSELNTPHQRLDQIEQRLRELGAVRIDGLAVEFGVSEMTIRRDLDELEALGVARRVRGGAVAVGPEPFAERHRHNARAKARIADKLLGLIPDRGTVAFDASTTVYRLAATLEGARDLFVVTNGLDTFQSLTGKSGVGATLTGGSVEPRTGSLVGPVAVRSAEEFMFDVLVCSSAALDPELGSSEASLEEAEVKRAFSRTSRRIVLAIDHSKLGTRAQARMFTIEEIDILVTDLDPTDPRLEPYGDIERR